MKKKVDIWSTESGYPEKQCSLPTTTPTDIDTVAVVLWKGSCWVLDYHAQTPQFRTTACHTAMKGKVSYEKLIV